MQAKFKSINKGKSMFMFKTLFALALKQAI